MEKEQLEKLVRSLLALSRETEWAEFKHNNADPEEIGEYISALANSAALTRQPSGFIIWVLMMRIIRRSGLPSSRTTAKSAIRNWKAGW